MVIVSSCMTRVYTLSVGAVLLMSLLFPVHGVGHTGHVEVRSEDVTAGAEGHGEQHVALFSAPAARGHGSESVGTEVGFGEASDDSDDRHPLGACCTGPCVCPPVPSPPSPGGLTQLQPSPAAGLLARAVSAAPLRGPLPHVLPFSTAPPGRV